MKLTTLFLAATLALVKAQGGSDDTTTTLPEEGAGTVNAGPTTGGDETGGTGTGGSPKNVGTSSALMEQPIMPLANKDEFHMKPIRVVHARAQFDQPEIIEGVMVSEYGSVPNDLAAGYIAGLDTVNTASVEGGLMFVQAECINQDSRAPSDRCVRKNNVRYMVFYEIMIAQTNETLAQFPDTGYGPMVPMDGGRCTPVEGETKLPNACYQFSGENGQPNLGPFVGGEDKSIDPRAPYLGTYWFSFPNSCATKKWGEKSQECIEETRAGLCPFGYNPNGVDCTYSYQILGYVPIDDIVGISSFKDKNGKKYGNYSNWCEASDDHIEFSGDDLTGEMKEGLPFWNDPTNTTANANRTVHMLSVYRDILTGDFESMDVEPEALKLFRPLPTPEEMEASNPKCYESIKSCGTGNGCKRYGYSQLCTPCEAGESCELPTDFVFPTLAKAETSLPPEETDTTKPNSGGGGGGGDGGNGDGSSAALSLPSTVTAAFVSVAVFFAL